MSDVKPRSVVVLSLDGTERTDLKTGTFLWGILLFGLGIAVGRWSVKWRKP